MTHQLRITNADVVEGDLVVVDLSDGRVLQITLMQLLENQAAQTVDENVPSEL